jgi:hypothetical protein
MISDDFSSEFRNGLKYLSSEDAESFARKFSERDELQKKDMLIELVTGVFGRQCGYVPEFEPELAGQKPDWLFRDRSGTSQFISEVVTRHGDEKIWGKSICEHGRRSIDDVRPVLNRAHELRDLPDPIERLKKPIAEKANKYRDLVEQMNLPFVICLYLSPELFLYFGRVIAHLRGEKDTPFGARLRACGLKWKPEPKGLLKRYPHVSGVVCIDLDLAHSLRQDDGCQCGFIFDFIANDYATRPISLCTRGSVGVPIAERQDQFVP